MKRKAVAVWFGVLVVVAVVSVAVGARLQRSSTAHGDATHGDTATTHDMQSMFPAVQEVYDDVTKAGVKVEFTVKSEDFFNGPTAVADGGLATVKLRLGDATSGAALTGIAPRAWIDTAGGGKSCDARVASWVRGQLTDRPLVDLNGAFVLTLDDAGTISVLDPLVNLAGLTQLYATVPLAAPAGDWALAPTGERLYASLPSRGEVAVVSTDAFRVTSTIAVGGTPQALVLSPAGDQLWAIDGATAIVVDIASATVRGRVATTAGIPPAFSRDGKLAYVVDADRRAVAIDTATLRPTSRIGLPAAVRALAVSSTDGLVYAGLADGSVHLLGERDLADQARLTTGDVVRAMRLSPDGRWAVALDGRRQAFVIDTAARSVARTVPLTVDADELVVDDAAAYVRSARGGNVDTIGLGDTATAATTTIVYAAANGTGGGNDGRRSSIAAFTSENAVLVTDPANRTLSFLPRGATAPSGSFALTGGAPRSVLVLPRGFRQEAPGVYTARFRVPSAGSFEVGVLVDDPRIVHCFRFEAAGGVSDEPGLAIALVPGGPRLAAGARAPLALRVTDPNGTGVAGLGDLTVSISDVAGNWSDRAVAVDRGGGDYEFAVTVPSAGRYRLTFGVPSRGLASDRFAPVTLDAA